MSGHTPGPWRYWATVSGARVAGHPADGSKNFVCDVLMPELAIDFEANARLIAAAPELLEALREVLDMCAIGDVDEDTEALGWGEAIKAARAAIAKATGEAA